MYQDIQLLRPSPQAGNGTLVEAEQKLTAEAAVAVSTAQLQAAHQIMQAAFDTLLRGSELRQMEQTRTPSQRSTPAGSGRVVPITDSDRVTVLPV